jgi:hypothetical protein
VVPCGVGRGMRRVRTPVDEGERAAHVGYEELLCRRGVGADGAEGVRERDDVGGRLGALVGPAAAAACAGGG